jgi:hypothetical protein
LINSGHLPVTEGIVMITECDYAQTVQLTTEDMMRKLIAAPIVAGLIGFAALAAPLAASAATADDPTPAATTASSVPSP